MLPSPTHTGSSRVFYILTFTNTQTYILKCTLLDRLLLIKNKRYLFNVTSPCFHKPLPDCISVEQILLQLVCVVLFLFQNVIYRCSVPAYAHRHNVRRWSVGKCFRLRFHSQLTTHVSIWWPALCSPSPISFSIALHSLVRQIKPVISRRKDFNTGQQKTQKWHTVDETNSVYENVAQSQLSMTLNKMVNLHFPLWKERIMHSTSSWA